jgi:hypothetical protein
MIQNAVTQPVLKSSNSSQLRIKGTGRVIHSPQKDIFTLETDSARYMIKAPGHTFEDGDEIDFELINGTVFLTKKTNSAQGMDVNILPRDELILQVDPEAEVLNKTLKSILSDLDSGENHIPGKMDFLKQLSERIQGQITLSQQEQLDKIVELAGRKNPADIPDLMNRIKALIENVGTDTINGTISLTSVSRLVIFPELMISEGIYQFQDMISVLKFLGNPKMDGWEKYLKDLFESEGSVWIRIVDTGDKYPGAFLVAPEALKNEMISMVSSVSNDILKQFPIETFLSFFNGNGGIDKNLVNLLNEQITNASNESMAEMSVNISPGARLQWLQTLNEFRDCPEVLAFQQPSRCTDLFRGLLEIKEKYGVLPGFSLSDTGIVPGSGKNAVSLFENTLNKIGFTTEHKLSKGVLPTGSVKTELYRLLETTQHTEQALTAVNEAPDKLAGSDSFDIFRNFRGFQSFLQRETSRLKNDGLQQNKVLFEMLSRIEVVLDQFLNGSDKPSIISTISGIPSEIRERLTELVNSFETMVQPKVSDGIAQVQTINSISSALDLLKQICSTIPVFHSQHSQLEDIMSELKKHLEKMVAENESQDPSGRRDLTDLQKRSGSEPFVDNDLHRDQGLIESGKNIPQKIVEQLINRIESLQILARQLTTPDGSSQILELPVKIGNEWTDVTLQIVKKEGRKKDSPNAQKHFSIYLDTEPSRLGGIHAVLDYEKGKNLSITVEFEHKEVASWFIRNQECIRKSLQENHIHFVNLSFKTRAVTDGDMSAENFTRQSTNVDVRA